MLPPLRIRNWAEAVCAAAMTIRKAIAIGVHCRTTRRDSVLLLKGG
jgi:hypothetical protein